MAIQELIDTLILLDEYHHDILKISMTKKSAIIENDVEKLIEIINQESRVLKQIEKLEVERICACETFLQEKGIKSQLELTVTELTRLVFDPKRRDLFKKPKFASRLH